MPALSGSQRTLPTSHRSALQHRSHQRVSHHHPQKYTSTAVHDLGHHLLTHHLHQHLYGHHQKLHSCRGKVLSLWIGTKWTHLQGHLPNLRLHHGNIQTSDLQLSCVRNLQIQRIQHHLVTTNRYHYSISSHLRHHDHVHLLSNQVLPDQGVQLHGLFVSNQLPSDLLHRKRTDLQEPFQ